MEKLHLKDVEDFQDKLKELEKNIEHFKENELKLNAEKTSATVLI